MNRATHESVGINFANVAFIGLHMAVFADRLSEAGVVEKPILALANLVIIALAASFGDAFPDFDQNTGSMPYKGFISYILHCIIHFTGGRHRSRQTHSADIAVAVCAALLWASSYFFGIASTVFLLAYGFVAGWISHLIADAFTYDGIYLLFWMRKRTVRFVPKEMNGWKVALYSILLAVVGFVANLVMKYYTAVDGAMQEIFYGAAMDSIPIAIVALLAIGIGIKYHGMRFKTGEEWEGIFRNVSVIFSGVTSVIAIAVAIAI